MLRATILFAVGLCANVLIGLPAMAQAPAEVTLTRIDCGTGATPTDVGQRFTDAFAYKDLKLTFTYSCYLIKHGGDYMVWDTGFTPGTSPNAPKVGSGIVLRTPGHTPGHSSLLVKLKEMGPVLLSGDAVHFRENYETGGVPSFNFDRAATVASIERMKQIVANLKATVVIQHDMRDIAKLPTFPAAAK